MDSRNLQKQIDSIFFTFGSALAVDSDEENEVGDRRVAGRRIAVNVDIGNQNQ